ncbi:MAG: 2OG-Fe(II) oxygenase [Steroidobacteraceae bacterium]
MGIGSLDHFIRVYDHDLEPALCARLIQNFSAAENAQKRNGKGVRAGLEESSWTEMNVSRLSQREFLSMFRNWMDRALERYNRDVGLALPIPNTARNSDLILKRYVQGQSDRFQLHFDSIYHVSNRYLVLLWYLNDVERGGGTRFPQLGLEVAARAGRLLVFPPFWMYQHEGVAPESSDKYIISTYLLFEQPQVQAS